MDRPRSLGLAGLLSIVQGAGLMSLGALGVEAVLASPTALMLLREIMRPDLLADIQFALAHFRQLVTASLFPAVWIGIGLGTLICGLGLTRIQVWAWLGSLVVEGLILAWTLFSHFAARADIIDYVSMASAIVIVLLLNQFDTQQAFRQQRRRLEEQMGQ